MEQCDSLAEGDRISMQSQDPSASNSDGHNPSRDTPSPRFLTTKPSFKDSAYESLTRSNNGTGSSRTSPTEEKHLPSRGKPFPGTDLTRFTKEIESSNLKRYEEVMDEINNLLKAKKAGWNKGNSYPSGMASQIRVLGTTETEAAPYLVVYCSRNLCAPADRFLRSKRVKKLYDKQGLKMIVVEHPPRMTSAVLDIDVCLNNEPTNDPITFCGSPMLLVDKSHAPSCVRTRKATIGGVIEVTLENGRTKQYGMTAGHAVEDLLSTSRAASYEVDHLEDSISLQKQGSAATPYSTSLTFGDDWDWESSFDAWESTEHTPIANILNNNSLPEVIAERAHPSHDWALFEMPSPKPNLLCNLETSKQVEEKPLVIASKPAFGDNLWDPVVMIGSSGLKRGRLSNLPGAIMRANSNSFVKTYMLELDEGYGRSRM